MLMLCDYASSIDFLQELLAIYKHFAYIFGMCILLLLLLVLYLVRKQTYYIQMNL